MKKYTLATAIGILTVIFVILGFALGDKLKVAYMAAGSDIRYTAAAGTPATALENLYVNIQRRQFDAAYDYLSNKQQVDKQNFIDELNGSDGSLRTYSALQDMQATQLSRSGDQAKVRAGLRWSTAVGAFYEARDFNAVRGKDGWKIEWVSDQQPRVPSQVMPVSYPRWDVIKPGATGVDVNEKLPRPKVRIQGQNSYQDADTFVIVGEVVNEDTVPAFLSITARITGNDGQQSGEESAFEDLQHTLLPGKKSPFRINFQGTNAERVSSVKLKLDSTLVSASADPQIEVTQVHVQEGGAGERLLAGELVSRSGLVVNIPHVIAAAYDNAGKVLWVQDTYLNRALLPQTPLAFAMKIPPEAAQQAKDFRFSVNSYRIE
jgi:hypothetical protein